MKRLRHSLKTRVTALLLALVCVLGLFPATAFAAGTDSIKLESFGMSGVSYQSASLGTCTLHQMYYDYGGKTTVGFCGTKGGGMGRSLIGQTWGDPQAISDPTVKMMMAYYYSHSTGTFTDEAHALGVDDVWGPEYTWYMNAWVQAIVWRYKAGSLGDPVTACAEELMYVWNSLKNANYTSIDQACDGATFRDRTQYIFDLGNRGVWGECSVYEYSFTGSGSSSHPANTVQAVVVGELSMDITEEQYKLTVKKVDATNPTKGLAGAKFHIEAQNSSFSKDIITGADGTYTLSPLDAGTYAITETAAPDGYAIDNAGPEYVVLPNGTSNSVTVTFTDTPNITATGNIHKVDADNPSRGLAGAVIKITGVDNNFTGTYTTGAGGALSDVPWDTMPVGSYVATEVTPPDGYSLSKDASKVRQEFYWDGKTSVSLVFENDAKVKIQLIKLDDSDRPLSGAVFNILKDGQLVGTEATDASGKITVTNVTEGMYTFVEVSAPAPYNEDLLYKLFGINAELLIDHAWGWEPCTIDQIKAYKPSSNSIASGQVLQSPYTWEKARLVVREMTDLLSLDLVDKGLVTDQLILTIGYDIENLKDPNIRKDYQGAVTTDHYGREIPKHATGTANLGRHTASTKLLTQAILELYGRITDPGLLVRRISISANHVVSEEDAPKKDATEQLDLFTDYAAKQQKQAEEETELAREKKMQETMLTIKKKFGKNAILKGMNLEDGATARDRNSQIGGHRA